MLLKVERVVRVLLDDLEDLECFGNNLDMSVSGCGGKARRMISPRGRHRHLGAV